MEWAAYEASLCSGCRQPRSECMAHEDDAPAYEAFEITCHACAARDRKRGSWQKADGGEPPGIRYGVHRAEEG